MSEAHFSAGDTIPLPPLMTSATAGRVLEAMRDGRTEIRLSLDLGLGHESVPIEGETVRIFGLAVTAQQLRKIVKRESVIFALDPDGPFPLEVRDQGYTKLVPPMTEEGAPTVEISGIKMHRSQDIDPFRDAKIKAEAAVSRGDYVLDTCGGLGYTATWARRNGAANVVSCERNPDVIALRRYNPWSQEYLRDGGIEKLAVDVIQHIEEYEEGYFDAVIHDPPRFSLAGELYGEEFIWQMSTVLKRGGRLVFYTGDPYRVGRGRNFIEGVEKRLRRARLAGHFNPELQAVVAERR
jgi:uncharacterized protein